MNYINSTFPLWVGTSVNFTSKMTKNDFTKNDVTENDVTENDVT